MSGTAHSRESDTRKTKTINYYGEALKSREWYRYNACTAMTGLNDDCHRRTVRSGSYGDDWMAITSSMEIYGQRLQNSSIVWCSAQRDFRSLEPCMEEVEQE